MSKEYIMEEARRRGNLFICELGENSIGLYAGPLVEHGITQPRVMSEMVGLFILAEEGRQKPENINPENFKKFLSDIRRESGL